MEQPGIADQLSELMAMPEAQELQKTLTKAIQEQVGAIKSNLEQTLKSQNEGLEANISGLEDKLSQFSGGKKKK